MDPLTSWYCELTRQNTLLGAFQSIPLQSGWQRRPGDHPSRDAVPPVSPKGQRCRIPDRRLGSSKQEPGSVSKSRVASFSPETYISRRGSNGDKRYNRSIAKQDDGGRSVRVWIMVHCREPLGHAVLEPENKEVSTSSCACGYVCRGACRYGTQIASQRRASVEAEPSNPE